MRDVLARDESTLEASKAPMVDSVLSYREYLDRYAGGSDSDQLSADASVVTISVDGPYPAENLPGNPAAEQSQPDYQAFLVAFDPRTGAQLALIPIDPW